MRIMHISEIFEAIRVSENILNSSDSNAEELKKAFRKFYRALDDYDHHFRYREELKLQSIEARTVQPEELDATIQKFVELLAGIYSETSGKKVPTPHNLKALEKQIEAKENMHEI